MKINTNAKRYKLEIEKLVKFILKKIFKRLNRKVQLRTLVKNYKKYINMNRPTEHKTEKNVKVCR